MSCSVLAQPTSTTSKGYQQDTNNDYSSSPTDMTLYFPSGFNKDYERFKRWFGSSILFLGITLMLTLVVFLLFLADCVFGGLDGEMGDCNGGSMIALIISSLLVLIGTMISIGLCIRFRREASVFWNDMMKATILKGTALGNTSNHPSEHDEQNQLSSMMSNRNNIYESVVAHHEEAYLETSLTLPMSPIKLKQLSQQGHDDAKPLRSFEFAQELAPRNEQFKDESSTLL